MADVVDIGNDTAEQTTSAAVAAIREAAKRNQLHPKGVCYSCDAPIEDRLFCNPECRDDYEHAKRRGL